MCRKSSEPVFLTKNGEGDLVVMDIETYPPNKYHKMFIEKWAPYHFRQQPEICHKT